MPELVLKVRPCVEGEAFDLGEWSQSARCTSAATAVRASTPSSSRRMRSDEALVTA
jgi:hypothetical protein